MKTKADQLYDLAAQAMAIRDAARQHGLTAVAAKLNDVVEELYQEARKAEDGPPTIYSE